MVYMDELWKESIEKLFPEFIEFFHSDIAKDITFDKEYTFLEKELQSIPLESERKKKGFVDKLVKVYLKDGEDKWVLIHVEVQGYEDADFSERMFKYFYRIFDKYKKKILAIAILTDPIKGYHPDEYEYEFYDTRLNYSYRTYKVIEKEEEELMEEENPFALAVLAVKYALEAKDDDDKKLKFKLRLIRLMLSRGYNREEIITLFRFIDGAIRINDEMKNELFVEELERMEEVKRVPYITSIEKIAMKKGREEGKRSLVKNQLTRKFGKIDEETEKLLNKASGDKVEKVALAMFDVKSLDEVKKMLS